MNAIKELNELVKRYENFTADNIEGIKKELSCYKLLEQIEEEIIDGSKCIYPNRYSGRFRDHEIEFLQSRGFKLDRDNCVDRFYW